MAFDPDWPHGHVTADGRKARIICKDRKGNRHIVACIGENEDELQTYTAKGRCGYYHLDLSNVPAPKQKLEFWVNVYPGGQAGAMYESKATADNVPAANTRIACKHIIVEEGEGLE